MNYPQLRRTELWVAFTGSAALGGMFSWLAITKELPFLWWFAGPFLVLLPLTAWKACQTESTFEREEEKFDSFTKRHPILSALLILGGIAGSLWSIGCVIFRVLAILTK